MSPSKGKANSHYEYTLTSDKLWFVCSAARIVFA